MLKTSYDSIDEIPEKYRDLFTEQNGKYVLSGVAGIKTQDDVDRVQQALNNEKNNHRETKDKLQKFGDLDADEVYKKLDRFDELEAASKDKLDDEKINELVEKRINSRLAPVERERDNLLRERDEAKEEIGQYQAKDKKRRIQDSLREVAQESGIRDEAVEDIFLYGENVFEENDLGQFVTKDGVGVTPGVDAKVWLTEMQPKRPHWWKESQGAGAQGNRGNHSGGKNPFTREHWNMTEQGKLLSQNRDQAEQMAKSAGTTIGGGMPEKK